MSKATKKTYLTTASPIVQPGFPGRRRSHQKLHPNPETLRQEKVQFAVDRGRPYVSFVAGIGVQYPRLAERLVNSSFFKGKHFSYADAFFAKVARGRDNSVDMGHWVQLDSNHHLSFVGHQVESFLALTASQRSSDEQLDAFMLAS